MRGWDLPGYFAERPLTEGELVRGRALRVAGCLRSGEGVFEDGPVSHVWVVLSCAREGRVPARPSCLALAGGGRLVRGVRLVRPSQVVRHDIELARGGAWVIDEYAFCVSDGLPRLVVTAGAMRALVGRALRDEMLRDYEERIANASVDPDYPEWLSLRRSALLSLPVPTSDLRMSVVTPAYRTPSRLLREMLRSVVAQTYRNWELVLVNASPDDESMREALGEFDDPRIKVVETPENLGIVGNTNLGISRCTGDYVSFLDHDDLLEACALSELVRAVEREGGDVGLLYCDEDNVDERGVPTLPLLKPGHNPDLLLSNDYVLHWLTVRRDLLAQVAPSAGEVEGAQDYDLTFKVLELGVRAVRVPHVLYHWRICGGSSAADPASKSYAQDAGTRAIEGHFRRAGLPARVSRGSAYFTYRTVFSVPDPAPDVAVVCPGAPSEATSATLEAYARQWGASVATVRSSEAGDLSRLAREASGLLLFVTPAHDLDLASLEGLMGLFSRDDVFAAAPRVVRTDGLFDYAGMVVRPDGTLARLLRCLPEADGGYVGRAQRPYDACAVNPECCLVRADALGRLGLKGGFSSTGYTLVEAFSRAYAAGLRNVFYPYATAALNEPRPFFEGPADDLAGDPERLVSLFPELAQGDPSHNPNFDPWGEYYALDWATAPGDLARA